MSDEPEVWVDTDYEPVKREPEKCGNCGNDLVLRHVCTAAPQPVKVSFEQTVEGTRMIYLSLTDRRGKASGKIHKTTTVSESPLVNFDWHADGTLLGIEVIA